MERCFIACDDISICSCTIGAMNTGKEKNLFKNEMEESVSQNNYVMNNDYENDQNARQFEEQSSDYNHPTED